MDAMLFLILIFKTNSSIYAVKYYEIYAAFISTYDNLHGLHNGIHSQFEPQTIINTC